MIVDPVTEYYDLVGSGHVSLYKTSPRLADDLKKYFIRCKEKNIHPNIDFTDEGFGLYANGAWDIIESTANECNVSIKDITIHISDMFAKYPCQTSPLVNDKWLQVYKPKHTPPDTAFKKFGHFVGRVSPDRLAMHVQLMKYKEDMWYSLWHGYDFDDHFFARLDGLNSVIIQKCKEVVHNLPQVNTFENPQQNDFYDWPKQVEPLHRYYANMFVDIVSETDLDTCFTTEKTLRPIIFKNPFLLMAGKGTLQKLKDIGFKTFDNWWSEDYDNFTHLERMEKILDIVDWISVQYNVRKFKQEMETILEHNYNHYVNQEWIPFAKRLGVPDIAFGDTRTWE